MQTHVNEMGNIFRFKINTWYVLELLTPGTMIFLDLKIKRKWRKKRWKCTSFNITAINTVHCNFVKNKDYQQSSRVSYTFIQNNHFVNY